ncbi:MAG: hypothetical protein J6M23_05040 [Bacteroidales bacterium]|nr:hypothetical protein [Bacteroidales bacterium]
MSESKFYASSAYFLDSSLNYYFLFKVNPAIELQVVINYTYNPRVCAVISRNEPLDDSIPKSTKYHKFKKITESDFDKYFKNNYESVTNQQLRGGEYYLEAYSGESFVLHAFFENPSRHISLRFSEDLDSSLFYIDVEHTIKNRRGIRNRCTEISEDIFIRAYRLLLEFFLDGSSMISTYEKLFKLAKSLISSNEEPADSLVLNGQFYFQTARDLMLKRKEEIKARLLDMDDTPTKRGELRAEMKGIEYCITVLENNH